jgi:hypothetical protein
VGVTGGILTEKFALKSGEQIESKIRATATYFKSDGKWRLIQEHRDKQQFRNPKLDTAEFLTKYQ